MGLARGSGASLAWFRSFVGRYLVGEVGSCKRGASKPSASGGGQPFGSPPLTACLTAHLTLFICTLQVTQADTTTSWPHNASADGLDVGLRHWRTRCPDAFGREDVARQPSICALVQDFDFCIINHVVDHQAVMEAGGWSVPRPRGSAEPCRGLLDVAPFVAEHMESSGMTALRRTCREGRAVADATIHLLDVNCLQLVETQGSVAPGRAVRGCPPVCRLCPRHPFARSSP